MKRRIVVSLQSVGRRAVVFVLNDSACVFAGTSCLVCSFAKNTSFMNCLFSLSASSSSDYSFFTDRTDEGDWSVGCLLMVLLIRLLTKHIHQTNVHAESFLCNILGLLSPFLDYGRSLQHASASRRSRHVGHFSLRS